LPALTRRLRCKAANFEKSCQLTTVHYDASETIDILQAAGGLKAETLRAEPCLTHRYDGLNDNSKSAGVVDLDR